MSLKDVIQNSYGLIQRSLLCVPLLRDHLFKGHFFCDRRGWTLMTGFIVLVVFTIQDIHFASVSPSENNILFKIAEC